MSRTSLALLGAALLSGCGRKSESPPAETPEYRAWKMSHTAIPAAGFAPTVQGRIQVLAAEARSKGPEDFCEIYLNGSKLYRCRMGRQPDGSWPVCEVVAVFREGPNWVDVWDSTSNRNLREKIDTREGTRVVFSATEDGYAKSQSKPE